jgi:hypothetical protein
MNKVLWVLITLTFALSVYNWYEGGYFIGFAITNFGAIAAASLAASISYGVSRTQALPASPFKVVAIFSAALSLIAYTFYAFNGRAENSDTSAAQMHVVIAPILLFAVTIFALFLALVASLVFKLWRRRNA